MIKYLVTLSVILAATARPAQAEWVDDLLHSIVKVTSSYNHGDLVLYGSGLLFSANKANYVVTSDHVLFQSNTAASITFTSVVIPRLRAASSCVQVMKWDSLSLSATSNRM